MSEEFDKEAEREKLREKLEKDQEKRQETQRMSELLLQGATMTNEHCENCGDPLFRDGGERFCPTCGGADGTAQEQVQQQAASQQERQPQQPPAARQTAEQTEEALNQTAASQPAVEGTPATTPPQQADSVDDQPTPRTAEPSTAADPRAELQRAVTRSARKANEATDPRTAKQWLEASKAAAEALEALDQ